MGIHVLSCFLLQCLGTALGVSPLPSRPSGLKSWFDKDLAFHTCRREVRFSVAPVSYNRATKGLVSGRASPALEDQGQNTKSDLWVLTGAGNASGERKPSAYLNSEFDESDGKFSADERFVAHVSDKSGM
jgi:hypothetical protein